MRETCRARSLCETNERHLGPAWPHVLHLPPEHADVEIRRRQDQVRDLAGNAALAQRESGVTASTATQLPIE